MDADKYLDRCLDLLTTEQVSETTLIIMFHEYAKLYLKEYLKNKEKEIKNTTNTKQTPQYGC